MNERVGDAAIPLTVDASSYPALRTLRRASRACTTCRSRKVRCDALRRRPGPCTNCELNGDRCTLLAKSRRFRAKLPLTVQEESTTGRESADTTSDPIVANMRPLTPATSGEDNSTTLEDSAATVTSLTASSASVAKVSDLASIGSDDLLSPRSTFLTECSQLDGSYETDSLLLLDNEGNMNPIFDLFTGHDLTNGALLDHNQESTMRFVSPHAWLDDWRPPPHVNQTEWEEICSQGMLSLPTVDLITHLFELFFTYFQPCFPVLCENNFYRIFHSSPAGQNTLEVEECAPRISLALLKAVMFVASSFLDEDDVKAEGFISIREMCEAYYIHAETLYKLGCTKDDFEAVQLCLLLTMKRSHSNNFFDNERWIVEAVDRMNDIGIIIKINQDLQSEPKSRQWRRLYCCWYLRAQGLVLGLKSTSRPDILAVPVPSTCLSDVYDDIKLSCFLTSGMRTIVAELFMARVSLAARSIGLCRVILDRFRQGRTGPKRSTLGEIEDSEISLREWRASYNHLFVQTLTGWSSGSNGSSNKNPMAEGGTNPDDLAFIVAQSMLKLSYDPQIYHLYVASDEPQYGSEYSQPLDSNGSGAFSKSASGIRREHDAYSQASPCSTAGWNYASNDVRRPRGTASALSLFSHGLLTALQNRIVFVFIPLTLHCLALKTSVRYDPATIDNLHVCASTLQCLAERYPVSDFFQELVNASLSLAHKSIATTPEQWILREQAEHRSRQNKHSEDHDYNVRKSGRCHATPIELLSLPPPQMHAAVIRFQDMSLATMSIMAVN
ncbi:hypothetical protein F5884DRAFT_894602 [Xylogone sp. PMI_703]|nr:hypothetical protein F5884DRAFT_894602 [Xylogone sp. PMI_703]